GSFEPLLRQSFRCFYRRSRPTHRTRSSQSRSPDCPPYRILGGFRRIETASPGWQNTSPPSAGGLPTRTVVREYQREPRACTREPLTRRRSGPAPSRCKLVRLVPQSVEVAFGRLCCSRIERALVRRRW